MGVRSAALLVLASLLLAGCGQPGASGDAAFATRIVFDERGTYYVGDPVVFQAQATVEVASWTWSLGDGESATGARVVHAFATPGTYNVTAVATDTEGRRSTATASVEILSLFGAPGGVPGGVPAPPPGDNSSIVRLELAGEEPVTGEPFSIRLVGPQSLGGGNLSLWIGEQVIETRVSTLPATYDVAAMDAGRQRIAWLAEMDGDLFSGTLTFDVWGTPRTFGAPTDAQWLRPGIHSDVCTVNFLFHYKWYRFFVGSAAHCVDPWGPATGESFNPCGQPLEGRIGMKQTLHAHSSSRATSDAWVAYESWLTMEAVNERSAATCVGNDFALIELGPNAQQSMHPAALFFGGPTSLAGSGYASGTTLYGYGASDLRGNIGLGYPGQEAVNRKQGVSLGVENGGFSQHLLYATPGVPGDSGGPAFGPGGEALGVASTITITPTPGTNRYTVVAKALEYMLEHEGWAPELVPYDDWSAIG